MTQPNVDPVDEVRVVVWVYHPVTHTLTAEVQQDGRSVVIATILADPPDE